ncbi:MAG: hypothetical protein J6K61_05480 [Clostridia bacterium]|nr:hypothetical protein [Clostridia bacterium]
MTLAGALGIGILGAVLSSLLKEWKSPYAAYPALLSGLFLLITAFSKIQGLSSLWRFFEGAGVSDAMKLVLKVLGVGYVSEIGAEICQELHGPLLASRLLFLGRVEIFLLCLPVLEELALSAIKMLG